MYTKAIEKQNRNVVVHFNEKCLSSTSPFGYVKVQFIEQVYSEDLSNIEKVLCGRKRYRQSQLFTVTHGMNSFNNLYSKKSKVYRKQVLISTINLLIKCFQSYSFISDSLFSYCFLLAFNYYYIYSSVAF